jgi:hypothetical protein
VTASRDRKQAAKILGITMQAQLRALLEAQGEEAIQRAAIQLGDTFNRNSEFICWVLKEYGGVEQMPFPRAEPVKPHNDGLRFEGNVPKFLKSVN